MLNAEQKKDLKEQIEKRLHELNNHLYFFEWIRKYFPEGISKSDLRTMESNAKQNIELLIKIKKQL